MPVDSVCQSSHKEAPNGRVKRAQLRHIQIGMLCAVGTVAATLHHPDVAEAVQIKSAVKALNRGVHLFADGSGRVADIKQSCSSCTATINRQGLSRVDDRRMRCCRGLIILIVSQRVDGGANYIVSVHRAHTDISKYHIVSSPWWSRRTPVSAYGPVATGGIIPSGCGMDCLGRQKTGDQRRDD